jgi:chromosome segregation ATPase
MSNTKYYVALAVLLLGCGSWLGCGGSEQAKAPVVAAPPLDDETDANAAPEEQMASLEDDMEALHDQIQVLADNVGKLSSTVAAKGQLAAIEERLETLDGAVKGLAAKDQSPAVEQEVKALDAAVKGVASKDQVAVVEQQVKALDSAVNKLSAGLVAKEQLASLERQLKTLTEQVGKLAETQKRLAQLQNDLDAARGEVKKSEQARQEADAKIKSMEQKIADLQKRAPEPEAPKEEAAKE